MKPKLSGSLLALLLIIFTSFTLTTAIFRTKAVTDFLYYWALAHNFSVYHKGGIIAFLYSPLTQLPAYWVALIVNGFLCSGAIVSLWAFARTVQAFESLLLRYFSTATVVLGILSCAAMVPVVGTDLPALFLFIIAITTFVFANLPFRIRKAGLRDYIF